MKKIKTVILIKTKLLWKSQIAMKKKKACFLTFKMTPVSEHRD